MAQSGSFSTNYVSSAFTLRVVWSENNINIPNNTSKVTVTAYLDMSSGSSLSISSRNNTFTINGTNYSFSSPAINKSSGSTKTVTLGSVTSNAITHGSDGAKSISIRCTFNIQAKLSGTNYTSFTASNTVSLTKIARLSSLSASNGTLGMTQTLTVTKQDSAYKHTITYRCGNTSGTITTNSSSTSYSFTPPVTLASENTTGSSVSLTFTIETFNGSNSLGTATKTITCTIPDSIKPSVTINLSDTTGYMNTYGNPIKDKSKLQIDLSVTLGGNSPINAYSVTVNGESFTSVPCVTGFLKTSGVNTITAKVTDKRGRSATATQNITVLDYQSPTVSALSVKRCNSNGADNDQGEYISVKFSGTVTALNNQNTATWKLQYKKSTASNYSSVTVSDLNNVYTATNYSYIFAADTGSSYDIRISVTDKFETVQRTTSASTALTIMHYKANGKGMSVGKVSELDNVFDVGFQTRFYGGIKYMVIPSGQDLNNLVTPGLYCCSEGSISSLANCPFTSAMSFTMKVESIGTSNQIRQEIITCHEVNQMCFIRVRYSNTWYDWRNYVPRGSFAMVKGLSSDNHTINSKDWERLSLTSKTVYNESNITSYALYVDFTGTIKTRIPGYIVLSGAIRVKDGLEAGDVISIRITRTYINDQNQVTTEGINGVWDQVCHSNGKHTCVVTPNICFHANAEDKFNIEVRNQTGARGTTIATDCLLSLYYM